MGRAGHPLAVGPPSSRSKNGGPHRKIQIYISAAIFFFPELIQRAHAQGAVRVGGGAGTYIYLFAQVYFSLQLTMFYFSGTPQRSTPSSSWCRGSAKQRWASSMRRYLLRSCRVLLNFANIPCFSLAIAYGWQLISRAQFGARHIGAEFDGIFVCVFPSALAL